MNEDTPPPPPPSPESSKDCNSGAFRVFELFRHSRNVQMLKLKPRALNAARPEFQSVSGGRGADKGLIHGGGHFLVCDDGPHTSVSGRGDVWSSTRLCAAGARERMTLRTAKIVTAKVSRVRGDSRSRLKHPSRVQGAAQVFLRVSGKEEKPSFQLVPTRLQHRHHTSFSFGLL